MSQLLQNTRRRLFYRASILAATFAFYSLYYRNLVWHYVCNVSLLRPHSFLDTFRMMRLVYSVRGYTAVFVPRLVTLYKLSQEVNRRSLPGDFVECGVYNGGSAVIMASFCEKSFLKRDVWLFDSFEGLPKPTDEDEHEAPAYEGWCHGELTKVKKVFWKLQIPESSVTSLKAGFRIPFRRCKYLALPSSTSMRIGMEASNCVWRDSTIVSSLGDI